MHLFGCLSRLCCRRKKIHNSVQPTIPGGNANAGDNGSGEIIHSLSRPSSKHADRAEEFSLAELEVATNYFSLEKKIGAESFGIVYQGKLRDEREVAIKRGEIGTKTMKFQETERAFEAEIALLSRLHHKHLNNVEKSSSLLNSWKMRIKILLDAARGIEYLHNHAVPPMIHRNIKSSNILLDANWTARVSGFGLSLIKSQSPAEEHTSTKAVGTVGYMDPDQYYGLNVLTVKSDVYSFGVVLLKILTGKKAIFMEEGEGGGLTSVVDYTVPKILAGELESVLDARVGLPEAHEAEAVELVAYMAVQCVNLEGKKRSTMADIVVNLERALSICNDSHGSMEDDITQYY
ncbi:hypothetical protein NE237_004815 [Protea cynaroides]|uniref:Protein kinase domain-containing protein n=1 Tax=Protea cynaroides TaxID=273540 RepID=A0A9Q0KK32_9MAGN|nr:hypothetical protein NE237_004815 [Protea cynaroides]